MKIRGSLLLMLAVVWVPLKVAAEDTDDSSGVPSDDSTAVQAFEEAKTLFNDGAYIEASTRFREANSLRPSWKLWFNIGQCEAAAKRNGLALEAFEKYLALGGDEIPEDRREVVLAEITRLRPVVGFLDIEAPDGSTVFVDRVQRGITPLSGALMIAAAVEHEVLITGADTETTTKKIQVAGGRTVKVIANPIASLTNDPPKQAEGPKTVVPRSPLPVVGWTIFGTGAAALVGGAVTGVLALSKSNALETDCPNKECVSGSYSDRYGTIETLSVSTDVLLAVGGTLAATGLVLAVVGMKKNRTAKQARVTVSPVAVPEGGGWALSGNF